jgi:hypothetical protein
MHNSDGNPWRTNRTYTPVVIKAGNTYKMWFTGKNSTGNYAIGYATVSYLEPPVEVPAITPLSFLLALLSLFRLGAVAMRGVHKR